MVKHLKRRDSRFHGNDKIVHIWTFYETVKIKVSVFLFENYANLCIITHRF